MVNAVRTQPGENIWLEYRGPKAQVLAGACAAKVEELGAHPFLIDTGSAAINSGVGPLSAAGVAALGEQKLALMKTMQGYIRVDDDADPETANVLEGLVKTQQFSAFIGGIGIYPGSSAHGPFVHVDTRPWKARW